MQGIQSECAWMLVGNDKPNTPVDQCPTTNNYESTGCGRYEVGGWLQHHDVIKIWRATPTEGLTDWSLLPVQLFHDFCHFSDISFVACGSSSEAGDFSAVTENRERKAWTKTMCSNWSCCISHSILCCHGCTMICDLPALHCGVCP